MDSIVWVRDFPGDMLATNQSVCRSLSCSAAQVSRRRLPHCVISLHDCRLAVHADLLRFQQLLAVPRNVQANSKCLCTVTL